MTDGYPVPNAPTAARTGGVRHILAAFPCKTSAKHFTTELASLQLYLDLAKALNRLEEAGEDPVFDACLKYDVVGDTGTVRWDEENGRWGVVQA